MTPYFAVRINIAGILVISGVLLGAYYVQFGKGEVPCPLCLIQRLGMLGVALGAMLNIRYGLRPAHYGVSLISAVFGASVSVRQILLHIVPGAGPSGYGSSVLGIHLYSWAFVVFAAAVLLIGIMLLFDSQFEKVDSTEAKSRKTPLITAVFFLIVLITLSNVITTFLECGTGQCPADPVSYMELGK